MHVKLPGKNAACYLLLFLTHDGFFSVGYQVWGELLGSGQYCDKGIRVSEEGPVGAGESTMARAHGSAALGSAQKHPLIRSPKPPENVC